MNAGLEMFNCVLMATIGGACIVMWVRGGSKSRLGNNTMKRGDGESIPGLQAAGLAASDTNDWLTAEPEATGDYAADRERFSAFWQKSARLIGRLPPPAGGHAGHPGAPGRVHEDARAARTRFLSSHADAVYDALTDRRSRFVRVQHLVAEAARAVPGLVPEPQQIAAEDGLLQKEKDGLEIDQGLFVAAVLRS